MNGPEITVVVNPAAGRGKSLKLIPGLEQLLSRLGLDFEVLVSSGPEDPERIAREASERGAGIVAALGGDGLTGMVAEGLMQAGSRTALAVIPTGTGNDFARTLHLDRKRPLSAARLLEDPRLCAVDVGRLTIGGRQRHFMNIAGAGFDSQVNETANGMKTRMTGTAKYVAALVKTLRKFVPVEFDMSFQDGRDRHFAAMLVAVGNGRSYGGGMKVCPAASLSDGKFDVCIVGEMGKGEFLRAFPKVFRGTHVRHPKVTTLKTSELRIDAGASGTLVAVYADGEKAGFLPATFEVLPGALRVVSP